MTRLLTASLAGALALVPLLSPAAQARKERATDVVFAEAMKPAGASGSLALLGVGVRTKTILNVKVYALGMYIDTAAAKATFARWKGQDGKTLRGDAELRAALLSDNVTKAIRMVMVRDVDGEDMGEAFNDSLGPRVRSKGAAAVAALAKFKGFFNVDELKEGTELLFTWSPGGTLTTSIGGHVAGEIKSADLASALFDTFIGAKPVSSGARTSIFNGLAKVLGE